MVVRQAFFWREIFNLLYGFHRFQLIVVWQKRLGFADGWVEIARQPDGRGTEAADDYQEAHARARASPDQPGERAR